jgi:hypothetical protein
LRRCALYREAGIEIKVVPTDDRRRGGRHALAGWANLCSSAPKQLVAETRAPVTLFTLLESGLRAG